MAARRVEAAQRLVSSLMLMCFTFTTLAPSVAWAHGSNDRAAPARVVDTVERDDLQTERVEAEGLLEGADTTAPKDIPDRGDLQDAATSMVEKKPAADATVPSSAGEETLALPSGADKSGVTSQAISVPKGSGTIQGMGESFSAQLSTGIATFSVPFALPAARGGAQPSLGLSYSSASGAGLAGMGWSVGVPFIARQTDRGPPRYLDKAAWHANQDRFVFNGGQELVPICVVGEGLECVGKIPDEEMPRWSAGHQYFRPRVEGSFLRFFWSPDHLTWRVQDKSGVTMELGVPLDGSESRSALEVNPDAKSQVYRWHLVRQYDTYGDSNPVDDRPNPHNVVVYRYRQDGGQAYLSDIYDTTPAATPTPPPINGDLSGYAHHTHLEYEPRTDPTTSYRSGWLMKQTQRLQRVDVTSKTYVGGASGERRLVRRYHLEYDAGFHASYLASVQVEGRCALTEGGATAEEGGVLGDTQCNGVSPAANLLPPMKFAYGHVDGFATNGSSVESQLSGYEAFDARLQQIGGDLGHSVDEELTDYFDINSDALPDVLVTAPGDDWGPNYGVFFNSQGGTPRTFGPVTLMGVAGVLGANSGSIKLSNQNVAPLDLDGDGIIDFLHMPKVKTYSVYTPRLVAGKWKLVGRAIEAASKQSPKIDLGQDALDTRVVDVNFDGLVDVVVSTGKVFQTFLSLGRFPQGDAQFGNGSWETKSSAKLSNDPLGTCVPYSGSPVRFSDPDIQLADMNGDGIQDILRLRRRDFIYWPGRGDGYWGTGKLNDCPAGSFGDKRHVKMEDAPDFSDINGDTLRVDDVNGDGLDDLVQVRFNGVDVWLNVDGQSWTKRSIIAGTPESPSYANRVRLMDINGSGTRDIVWGNGDKYQFIDLDGGERPGVLTRVENGLGKSTDIEYGTSTAEMLAAERTGVDCDPAASPFARAWCSKMPMVTHLVKRVTESDNLSVAGSGVGRYVTEYTYADPVYQGWQREFRGFRHARSKRLGDANSPTDITESTFLLGELSEGELEDELRDCGEGRHDNRNEALKGLPIITERYDVAGRYLSTEATTYRLRHLYDGLDCRVVRHAFESGKRTTLYDTASPTVAATTDSLALVENELDRPFAATSNISGWTWNTLPAETTSSASVFSVPRRATSGFAVVASSSRVDAVGNRLVAIAHGCVNGDGYVSDACPGSVEHDGTTITPDEQIYSFTQPGMPAEQTTGWLYRTTVSWSQGSSDQVVRGHTATSYTPEGAPETTTLHVTGMIGLARGTTYPSRPPAPDPVQNVGAHDIIASVRTYDPLSLGNLVMEAGAGNRCRAIGYEAEIAAGGYAQLPTREVTYTAGCPTELILNPPFLQTSATYDRGLSLVTSVMDMTFQTSFVHYDQFGRLIELRRPSPEEGVEPLASVLVEYGLPPLGSNRPYSIIHTQAQDGRSVAESKYLESYSYIDGMGRARVGLSEADPVADDDHSYIVSSIAEFDAKGAVRRKYLPHFPTVDPNPATFPVADAPPDAQYGRQRYDAFGRQVQTFDVDGTVTLQSRYHALSTDLYDAADLYPGPHQGSFASTRTDGHGRTIATTERVHVNGVLEAHDVRTKYLASGQPQIITRLNLATDQKVVRWMVYDSLGRMVMNADPHATVAFTETPSTNASLKTWHYLYNDAGDLIGTSDARGCGQNFVYDGAGRLKAEEYSPCVKEHPAVATLNLTTGAGYEVFYEYDDNVSASVTAPDDYDEGSDNLKGRLKAVHDRAATTWFEYDVRGRTTKTFRKVSYVGAPQTTVAARYVDRWYSKSFEYDAADRPVDETTGVATDSVLRASNGESSVKTSYTARGTLDKVDSSYGLLVSGIKRSADGLVQQITFGDAATTQTAMRYDSRRRLGSVQTFRQEANLWSTAPPAISPAVAPGTDPTRQLLLQDLDYSYDIVNNPTEIRDWRTADEWPDGAKPTTRRMEYDDLYRVTRVDYEYPGGFDKSTSPYASEIAGGADSRRAVPSGHRLFAKRPLWHSYRYDWFGNTTRTDDDQHAFWDRSLGDITNNTTGKPYQFSAAIQPSASSQYSGSMTPSNSTYDYGGNLTGLQIARSTANCAPGLAVCSSRYTYDWDEVGRLATARRIEGSGPTASGPWLDFLYDASDERVVKQHWFSAPAGPGPKTSTLYIFDSLEVRRAPFNTTTLQYTVDSTTEVAYLAANGMRLARLHYEQPAKGEPQLVTPNGMYAPNLHVLLNLPDHLGSSSLVIDLATGELVEARTYQPYGATESDYRPERWKGSREDYGFTGKEEDVEVGLTYFGKRYLSPYLGRWISADPLAVHAPGKADLNLYAYVHGRVLKNVDPIGLDDATDGAKAAVDGYEQQIGDIEAESEQLQFDRAEADEAGDQSAVDACDKLLESNKKAVVDLQGKIDGLKEALRNRPAQIDIGTRSGGGRADYYRLRDADFVERNPGKEKPDYYLGYADGGLQRFTQTRENLSPEGKGWATFARWELQAGLESLVASNPERYAELERYPEAFRDYAFQVHVPAYIDAGIAHLPVMDRAKIMLTPRVQDIVNAGGINQIIQTGVLVLAEDFAHGFALDYGFGTGPQLSELWYAGEEGW